MGVLPGLEVRGQRAAVVMGWMPSTCLCGGYEQRRVALLPDVLAWAYERLCQPPDRFRLRPARRGLT